MNYKLLIALCMLNHFVVSSETGSSVVPSSGVRSSSFGQVVPLATLADAQSLVASTAPNSSRVSIAQHVSRADSLEFLVLDRNENVSYVTRREFDQLKSENEKLQNLLVNLLHEVAALREKQVQQGTVNVGLLAILKLCVEQLKS